MTTERWEIVYYERANGRCPVLDFMDHLPVADLVLINNDMDRLEQYGPDLGPPYVSFLRDQIWELRSRVRHTRYRFLFCICPGSKTILLLHALIKKAGRVADVEIRKAIEYRADCLGRDRR
jgi:hypothetical protein